MLKQSLCVVHKDMISFLNLPNQTCPQKTDIVRSLGLKGNVCFYTQVSDMVLPLDVPLHFGNTLNVTVRKAEENKLQARNSEGIFCFKQACLLESN